MAQVYNSPKKLSHELVLIPVFARKRNKNLHTACNQTNNNKGNGAGSKPGSTAGQPLPGHPLAAPHVVHEGANHLARPRLCPAVARRQEPNHLFHRLKCFKTGGTGVMGIKGGSGCWHSGVEGTRREQPSDRRHSHP